MGENEVKKEDFNVYLIRIIKEDNQKGCINGWVEERMQEVIAVFKSNILHILDGGSVVVLGDSNRQWFVQYITQQINFPSKQRPLFPIFDMNLHSILEFTYRDVDDKGFASMRTLLSNVFNDNYLIWYIGAHTKRGEFAFSVDRSFLWLIDWEISNSINFSSSDRFLDFKLMYLYTLFERTLCDSMYGRINL